MSQSVLLNGSAGQVPAGDTMHPIQPHHRAEIAFRYFWYKFKLLIRQNVNVDKNFFASDCALKLTNGVLPKGTKITCAGRTDGLGMQALARMSGISFAKAFGATYVDTPFQRIGHAPSDMGDWIAGWESLFNFDQGEESVTRGDYRVVNYADYLRNKIALDDKTVLRFQQCYWLHRRYPDSFKTVAKSFQDKVGLAPRRGDQGCVVAVHVRRGDVSPNYAPGRFTPNQNILRTIKALRQMSEIVSTPITIEMYSQGKPADFAEFAELGCRLHLDTDAVWTMRQLMEADMLVMAKSSFSYVAAVVNRGVKIYEPTFNPRQSDWTPKRRDGSFDHHLAAARLSDYLAGLPHQRVV